MRVLFAVGLACLAMAGCVIDVDYGSSAFRCESASQQGPDGLVCEQGVCVEPGTGCPADWFDCSFSRRLPLSFDNSAGVEELVAFPALVRLVSSDIDYTQTNDDGSDLRVVADDGSELPFEIERWDETGESALWIQLPRLGAGESVSVHLYYGNPEAADAQTPSSVWNASYAAVWHLSDPADGMQRDSTSNQNHGAHSVGMEATAAAQGTVGGALAFDGVDDWVQIEHSDSLTISGDQVTLEAWFNGPTQTGDEGFIVKTPDGTQYHLQLGVQGEGVPNFRVHTPTAQTYLSGASSVSVDQWQYAAGIYDGQTARVVLDGAVDATEAQSGELTTNTEPVLIGRRALGDERYFEGRIDEVRISTIARSEAWIAASYRSVTGAMLAIGSEQAR